MHTKLITILLLFGLLTGTSIGSEINSEKPANVTNQAAQEDSGQPKPRQFSTFAFWSTEVVNLPTTKNIGSNDVLFRISHRFYPKVSSGYDTFYGLNGGAQVYFSFGYGITKNLSVTLGHGNLFHEWDLSAKWLIADQWKKYNLPVSVAFNGGAGLITQALEGEDRIESKRVKLHLQLVVARQFSDALSVMLVPSYASNTNRFPFNWDRAAEATFTLGSGGRFAFSEKFALVGEWLPVLSGYKSSYDGWGAGLEYKVGGHVFHLFITNSLGLIADQYLTGGDLQLSRNEFRFGFNLYRTFWF